MAHSVYAYSYTPSGDGVFVIGFESDVEKRDAVAAEVERMVEEVIEGGVTEEELEKARKSALAAQFETLTSMRGQASDLGSNWMLTRNLDFTRQYVEAIGRVDSESIQAAAKRWLREDALNYVSLNPPGSAKAVEAPAVVSGEGEIVSSELDNGLTLLVKRDGRLPLVSVNACMVGGTLMEKPGRQGAAQLWGRTVLKGAGERSAEEIADAIEGVGGGIDAGTGNNSFSVAVDVLRDDLGLALEVTGDVLRKPLFLESAFENERKSLVADLREDALQPMSLAMRNFRNEVLGDHPLARNTGGKEGDVAAMGRGDVEELHGGLVRGGNTVLTVFGDVEPGEVSGLVQEHLEGLREGGKIDLGGLPQMSGMSKDGQCRQKLDKEQAVVVIGVPTVSCLHEDGDVLDLIDECCSDMASRLFLKVREEMGLAYYVGATQLKGLSGGALRFCGDVAGTRRRRCGMR